MHRLGTCCRGGVQGRGVRADPARYSPRVSAYVGALTVLLLAALALVGLYAGGRIVAVGRDPLVVLPHAGGGLTSELAASRFHARWYAATLVFLAFDVEMLFMYPWALVVSEVGAKAVVEMFGFLVVLMAAVVWAWREGAFRWA